MPPLAEQQRIVGLLDEAFEGIATAKANAEKNLHNTRALFESLLQSVFSQRGKALTADYVLEYRNTKLAVVEAKAWDVALTEGVAQAKNYADKLSIRFTYSANGQGIYGIDMETGKEGDVS